MKKRLPEHFVMQLMNSLASQAAVIVLWALKENLQVAKNDTVRSLDWRRRMSLQAVFVENYESNHHLENCTSHPIKEII